MYELAYLENGHLVRGGIKAPLLTVEEWLTEVKAGFGDTEWAIVPASEKSITQEELYAKLDAITAEYEARHDA